MEFWLLIYPYLLPVYYLCILGVVINILLENRNPLKTHSFLLALLLLPVLGLIIYLVFGRNARKRKIFSRKKLISSAFGLKYASEFLEKSLLENIPKGSIPEEFHKLIYFLNRDLSPLTKANRVTLFNNGEEKFPELLKALKNAQSHIHLEYYIYSNDDIGKQITEILIQKAQNGISVKLIIDDVGSFELKRDFYKKLRAAGVLIHKFRPVIFPLLTSKINYRDHRKIVVVDGKIAFTGGINIDDRYLNNGKHQLYWRDTHLMIAGEGVKTLQFLFLLNWQFVSKTKIEVTDKYFPKVAESGNQFLQINASGPDWELASIMDSFFIAINSARERIRITTPYFIPTESILDSIIAAAASGIKVELMLPYKSDSRIVHSASLSFMTKLLKKGVKVLLYKKGFMHAKTMTIDGQFSSVGTANMDYRSFDLNHEVNTYIYDSELTKELDRLFELDEQDCITITLEEWKKRSLGQKLRESVSRLLAPIL